MKAACTYVVPERNSRHSGLSEIPAVWWGTGELNMEVRGRYLD